MFEPLSLAQLAIESLHKAAQTAVSGGIAASADQTIWQPNSWLLQRCWQTLADTGASGEALAVASLAAPRRPLAPFRALYRVAKQTGSQPDLSHIIEVELHQLCQQIFESGNPISDSAETTEDKQSFPSIHFGATDQLIFVEQLLLCAATASIIGDSPLAFSCLERLDQLNRSWDRIFVHPELRQHLADLVAQSDLHPLVQQLMQVAVREYSDSGTQFIQQIAQSIKTQEDQDPPNAQTTRAQRRRRRILDECVRILENALLTSLHSQRIAAVVMAQAGLTNELLNQLHIIANIQDAHRETDNRFRSGSSQMTRSLSYSSPVTRDGANELLRQVTRLRANLDIDFQVYTLRNAIDAFPLATITDMDRVTLSHQLTELGVQSDGWTAAGAAATLVKLGSVAEAIAVVEQIAPDDPTRSEGILTLVDGLMEIGEQEIALAQAEYGLRWAESRTERNSTRAMSWGLAKIFIQYNRPQLALQFLEKPPAPFWSERLRLCFQGRLFVDEMTDDELQAGSLRAKALLQLSETSVHPSTIRRSNGHLLDAEEYRSIDNPADTDGIPFAETSTEDSFTDDSLLTGEEKQMVPEGKTEHLVQRLGQWAPQLMEGEALFNFYVNGLLRPLLAAGRMRHAWGLLPKIQEALLSMRGSKHALRVTEVMELLLAELAPTSPFYDAERAKSMRLLLEEFAVTLWEENARAGIWQAIYGIEGTLSLLTHLEGPRAILTIAHAAVEYGEYWSSYSAILIDGGE